MKLLRSIPLLALAGMLAACQDAPTSPDIQQPAQQVLTGWIFDVDGTPLQVRYVVRDGRGIHEGDIDLGPAGEIAATREALTGRTGGGKGPRQGVAINGSSNRWSNGVVPYVISTSFTTSQRQMILDAMAHISANVPGLSFVARTSQSAYTSFAPHASSCSSPVGRQGGSQAINLASGCFVLGIVVHEILHTVGMWHEQSRCDRDSYITVNLGNVISGQGYNFDKKCSGSSTVFSYDEGSVMHYGAYDFSSNGQPTITSLRGLAYLMGQRSGMSGQDVQTAVWLYPTAPTGTWLDASGTYASFGWTDTHAVQYAIYLRTEERWTGYEGSGSSAWTSYLGTTTGTSFTDTSNPVTGVYSCEAPYDPMVSRETFYSYEIVADYGYGVTRTGYTSAPVAAC